MLLTTRTARFGLAALAVTTGVLTAAGPAAAETGSSSAGTGSAEVAQGLVRALACAVGAASCPIVIPG